MHSSHFCSCVFGLERLKDRPHYPNFGNAEVSLLRRRPTRSRQSEVCPHLHKVKWCSTFDPSLFSNRWSVPHCQKVNNTLQVDSLMPSRKWMGANFASCCFQWVFSLNKAPCTLLEVCGEIQSLTDLLCSGEGFSEWSIQVRLIYDILVLD